MEIVMVVCGFLNFEDSVGALPMKLQELDILDVPSYVGFREVHMWDS
jgi:hypothetical protein